MIMPQSFMKSIFGFFRRDRREIASVIHEENSDSRAAKSSEPDEDLDWLWPPSDIHDVEAWDKHWQQQIEHGLGPPIFDMFCDGAHLVDAMRQRDMKTILCAGSGISQEARALSEGGFDVIALDSSAVALEIAQHCLFTVEDIERYYPLNLRRPGGSMKYVVGNLLDPNVAPGPFDVVIERCTLQLFPPLERAEALQALADRLSPSGIFVSHCHNGGWRPEEPRVHFLENLFREKGWTIEDGYGASHVKGKVARLSLSTG